MKTILLLAAILLVGCGARIEYINQTIEKEVIKECPANVCTCTPPDCNCNYPKQNVTIVTKVDTMAIMKCRLQNGRYVAELDYYKNITAKSILNTTYNEMNENLTLCIEKRDEYKKEIDKIKELVN